MTPSFVPLLRLVVGVATCLCVLAGAARSEDAWRVAVDEELGGDRAVFLGFTYYERADLPAAEAAFRRAIQVDPLDGVARVGLASVYVAQTRPEAALEQLALAQISTSTLFRSELQAVRAQALLLLRRNAAAHAAVRDGLRQNPFDADLVEVAAQVAFRRGDMARATVLYQRATALDPTLESANLRLGSGFGPPLPGTPWRKPPQRTPFREAVRAWEAGDLERASAQFRDLVLRWPENFKHRLGLGLTLREQRLQRNAGANTPARYRLLPAPDVADIERFIPQWRGLSAEARHVCRVAIAPARAFLNRLIRKKARHDILSLDALLTEAPERSAFDRTPDGRRWRQLRGVGGREAATGVDKLRIAALFGFNTFAHEFAHQLLTYGFTKGQWREVQRLYLDALEHGRCLDYYAATNIDEYFAQGYEAYLSLRKNGRLRETARHTRDELKRRDRPLYDFLERTFDWSHETHAALEAFWKADQGRR